MSSRWRKWHFTCKKKRGFLWDEKFIRKPPSHNTVLTLLNTAWRKNTSFLVDVIVRQTWKQTFFCELKNVGNADLSGKTHK